MSEPYYPPRPKSLPAVVSLIRVMRQGDGDLLSLLPANAYWVPHGPLGYSRRSIIIINDPELVRIVLNDENEIFPKSDLMVNAVENLIGDSIFVSSGATWRRQRAMIDPAFSAMRINTAFPSMVAAVGDQERHLDAAAEAGEPVSLDLTMSHLTADVICRTVFSTSLQTRIAHEVFEDFAVFERSVAQVEVLRLIWDKAWTKVRQKPDVVGACERIRSRLGELVDTHLDAPPGTYDDIASSVIAATDPETGDRFSRDELIDQLGVFFLAGHETTASALTWALYIIASRPEVRDRMRAEIDEIAGEGDIQIEHTKKLVYTRNVFREVLRLYPPITFLPRVATAATRLGSRRIKRGALVMIAPWVLHRHQTYWKAPDVFDPDRFQPERERDIMTGSYLPFGQGPRICAGAAFATIESVLILARLVRRYDLELLDPENVRPVARMTTRPSEQIMCRVKSRDPRR